MGPRKTQIKFTILRAGLLFSLLFYFFPATYLFAADDDFSYDVSTSTYYEEPEIISDAGAEMDSTWDALEPIESSAVDIVLSNANQAAITQLNKGMEGLSSQQRLEYVREHGDEYRDAGAVSVFAGENIGEVVVNGDTRYIQYSMPVEYQPLGKPELGHTTLLQGALLELTKYPENANIKETTVPALTYKLVDGKSMTTVQSIVPGVLASCVHGPDAQPNQTINLGYVGMGEKEGFDHFDRQFVVDRVVQGKAGRGSQTDARLISLKTPDILSDFIYNPIPVMPLESNAPQKGDDTRMFLRGNEDDFGIKYPERISQANVAIDFSGFSNGAYPDHWTKHQVMNGHSGTFEYKLDNNGNIHLLGPVSGGLKFTNPSPFGAFVNPKFVTELRDKLVDEYQSIATGGLTQSEKGAIMKQFSDTASREHDAQLNREREEKDREFFKLKPSVHVSLPGDPE